MYNYNFEIPRQRLAAFLESLPESAENITVSDSPRGAQFLKASAVMDRGVFFRWFMKARYNFKLSGGVKI